MSERKRLPPNQQLLDESKWPIIGERLCQAPTGPWIVSVTGLVSTPLKFNLQDLAQLPQVEMPLDIHCVTRWSRYNMTFKGVLLETLLEKAGYDRDRAQFVSFQAYSSRNHSTSLVLSEALEQKVLLATEVDNSPLPDNHGGPVRVITPWRYFYKSLKWLKEIKVLEEDELGYWEKDNGYHNHADPWKEERYVISDIDIVTYRELLKRRDFSHQNILSIDAEKRNLEGLNAASASLRNARFHRTQLANANFTQANLSNAEFIKANLYQANFTGADLEGANFSGADLRFADFTGSSLFGSSFFDSGNYALINHTTKFDQAGLAAITPEQLKFVEKSLTR